MKTVETLGWAGRAAGTGGVRSRSPARPGRWRARWRACALAWAVAQSPFGAVPRAQPSWPLPDAYPASANNYVEVLVLAPVAVRVRGWGFSGSASGFVETSMVPPAIRVQPVSRVDNAGTAATLSVAVDGSAPLSYRWRKDGVPVTGGTNVSGAATASLAFNPAFKADEGDYTVVIANLYGSVTSVVARLTVQDPFPIVWPQGRVVTNGQPVELSVVAGGTEPLAYQWRKDGVALVGATNAQFAIVNVRAADEGDYDVAISNPMGSITSWAVRVRLNVVVADGFNPGADGAVAALAVQPDGRVLVGGGFGRLGGQPRRNLARVEADGRLDTTFDPSADSPVAAFALQPDGRIVVGGMFTQLAGQPRRGIGRLSSEGSLDPGFNPSPNGVVNALAWRASGGLLVGGQFTRLDGQPCNRLGHLSPDGHLDGKLASVDNGSVYAALELPDGSILAGGSFTLVGGVRRRNLARLQPDGRLDPQFDLEIANFVSALALQPDGKVLMSGGFSTVRGQRRRGIARLHPDGRVDGDFDPSAVSTSGYQARLALQADGRILVSGSTRLDGVLGTYAVLRLRQDGSLDPGFYPTTSGTVWDLTIQPDGAIVLGGDLAMLCGESRQGLGRLEPTEPATESFLLDGSAVTWLRGGTSPEVSHVHFDALFPGSEWMPLGAGQRIPGGWRLTAGEGWLAATIRARGFNAGGGGVSSWCVESFAGRPWVTRAPLSRTSEAGATAAFAVGWVGSGPVSYQWTHEGTNLVARDGLEGHTNAILTLSGLLQANAGAYAVVLSNRFGSVTSVVARLSVVDPRWVSPPRSQVVDLGQRAGLDAVAAGTEPLLYQWHKDGQAVRGATNRALVFAETQLADSGLYTVTVSNAFGLAQTAPVSLTVRPPGLGETLWEVRPAGAISSSPALSADGTLYVGTWDGRLYALDAATGTERWWFAVGRAVDSSPAVGADGTVYFGSWDRNVYAVDGTTGTKRWQFRTGGEVHGSPAVGVDGTVFIGSYDYRVYALDGATGARRWDHATSGSVYSSPAVGEGLVYVGSTDGSVYALESATGERRWRYRTGGAVRSSPALGGDGAVYVGSEDQKVYALDGLTGAKRWESVVGSVVQSSPTLGSEGTVYLGCEGGQVYALDGTTGAPRWGFPTGARVWGSPALAANGTVYAGSESNRLHALHGVTGIELWTFVAGRPLHASPTVGSDGTVYVCSFDGRVFALRGDAPLAQTPWPKFRANAANTGVRTAPPRVRPGSSLVVLREGIPGRVSLRADGVPEPTLQWFFNGVPILGATGYTLTVSNVTSAHEGLYVLIASNRLGQATSAPIAVVVGNVEPQRFPAWAWQADPSMPYALEATEALGSAASWHLRASYPAGTRTGMHVETNVAAQAQFFRLRGGAAAQFTQVGQVNGWGYDAAAGTRHRIEYVSEASGWTHWLVLTNVTLPVSPYLFVDFESFDGRRRVYRTTPLP